MPTETKTHPAEYVVPPLKVTLGYGQMLANDIPAENFARMPHANMNHPAFCFGHLAFYANRLLERLGHPHLATPDLPNEEALFKDGAECVEGDGHYPDREAIMDAYVTRHESLIELIPALDESVFAKPNPAEGRFREMCPTMGSVITFLSNSHHMIHLGQVSGWRRAMGMGPVM